MKFSTGFATLLGAVIMAISKESVRAQPSSVPVQQFSKVQVCTPFSVLIKPGGEYTVTLDAEQSVRNAVSISTGSDGTLTLGTTKSFESAHPIKLVVTAPAASLQGVVANSPIGSAVTVASGFMAPMSGFSVLLSGAASIYLLGLDSPSLTLSHTGAGAIVAKGSSDSVAVTNNGAGRIYVGGGTIKQVRASVGGAGILFVDPTNADAQITGSTQLLGKIEYTRGSCSVNGGMPGVTGNPAMGAVNSMMGGFGGTNPFGSAGGIFGSSCNQVPSIEPPTCPKWTSGISVSGVFDCSGSTASSSSSSGGGIAFSGATGPGGVHFTQSSGSGQSVVTSTGSVRTIPSARPFTEAELQMS